MTDFFFIKQGDLLPVLEVHAVKRDTGDSVDLAGGTPKFLMRPTGVAMPMIATSGGATLVNASLGHMQQHWQSDQTATAGLYQGEFEFTFSGKPQTIPGRGYIAIQIGDDIG